MTKRLIRIISAVFLLLCPLIVAGEFKVTASLEGPQIWKTGDDVMVKMTGTHPEGYVIAGWRIIGYVPSLPEKFAEKTGLKVNVNRDPKWSDVPIVPWTWLGADKLGRDELLVRVKTAGWPKGDYRLNCTLIMRVKAKPEVATDKYVTSSFVFSLE